MSARIPFASITAKRGRRQRAVIAAAAVEWLETRLLFANISSIAGAGDWNSASTWVGMVVPGNTDDVTIVPGAHVSVTQSEGANSLLTQQGSFLTISKPDSNHVGVLTILSSSGGGNISNIGGALEIDAGAMLNPPQVGTLNVTGTTILSGTLQGGTVDNIGAMTVAGGTIFGGALSNDGTMTITGGLSIAAGTLTNNVRGIINIADDGGFNTFFSGGGGQGITNSGTLNKNGGSGTFTVNSQVFFDNIGGIFNLNSGNFSVAGTSAMRAGSINVAAGSTYSIDTFAGGQNYVADTVTGTGAGTISFNSGTFAPGLHPGISGPTDSDGTFNFPQGMAKVTGGAFINRDVNHITNTGFLDFVGSAAHGDISMINQGTITNSSMTDLPAAFLTNDTAGLISLQTDAGISPGNGNAPGLTNFGVLRKSAGAGVSIISADYTNKAGSIEVATGTLSLRNNGNSTTDFIAGAPLNIATGATLDFQFSGGIYLSGTLSSTGGGKLTFTNGTLSGVPSFDSTYGTLPAILDFALNTFYDVGGVIDAGNTGVTNTGTINFQGENRLNRITNQGTFFIDAGPFFFSTDVLNDITGIIDFTADTASTQSGVLTNKGTILKSGGSGTLNLANGGGQYVNQGTIEAASGTLELPGNNQGLFSFTPLSELQVIAGETLKVDAGATLALSSPINLTTITGAVILDGAGASFPALSTVTTNNGTLAILNGAALTTTAALVNTGTLRVGGNVTITGDFTESQAAGSSTPPTLDFAVAGSPGAPGAPVFTVTGNTTLAGNLIAEFAGGFGAAAGSSYTAATFSEPSAGSFASTAGVGPDFTVAVNPTSIVLNSTAQGTADLAVTSVSIPATFTVAQQVAIQWNVANNGANASGDWIDSVYLSADGTIDAADQLLGRVTHTGGLAANASYTGSLTAAFPTSAGVFKVVVETDSGLVIADTNRANNVGVSAPTTPNFPVLTLNSSVSGTLAAGQDVIYQLVVPGGSDVRVSATLPAPLLTDLEVSRGVVPFQGSAQFVAPLDQSSGMLATTLTQPQPGIYYIHLFGQAGAGSGVAFTLAAATVAFAAFGVSPSMVGAGKISLTVNGAGFGSGSTAKLVDGGGNVVATAATVTARDPNTLLADFDLTGVAAGAYSLVVTTGANSATLSNAVTVQPASAIVGQVQYSIVAPSAIRFGHVYDLYVRYTNPNNIDVPAPLFEISGANIAFRLAGGAPGSNIQSGAAFSNTFIDLLAINQGGEAGTLPANYTGLYDIQFKAVNDLPHTNIFPRLSTPAPTDTFDLSGLVLPGPGGESLLSTQILAAEVNGLTALPGGSLSSSTSPNLNVSLDGLSQYLAKVAGVLSGGGLYEANIADLIDTAEQSADGFGAVTRQQQSGAFGQGASDPLKYELVANPAAGYVDFVSPSGTRRFLSSGGTFTAASANNTGTLSTQSDGTLRLTELDGSLYQFNSLSKLAYYQTAGGVKSTFNYDANGNVTSTVSGNGQTTTYTYNASNIVTSSTDSFGLTTTFGYQTVTGPLLTPGVTPLQSSLLTTITSPAGTTTLTYTAGSSPSTTSLISSITLPDGSGMEYTYDALGRIAQSTLLDGSSSVNYGYDATGLVITSTYGDGTSVTSVFGPGGETLSSTSNGQTMHYSYGATGLLNAIIDPNGANFTFRYSASGQTTGITSATGALETITYDSNGRVTGLKDAKGNQSAYSYDSSGQLASITLPDGSKNQYAHDSAGKINQIIGRGGQVTGITYNANGQITKSAFADGSSETYIYDASGNQVSATGPEGTTTFVYNAANDVTSISYPGGQSVSYIYDSENRVQQESDQTGVLANYTYDANARLATVSDGSGAVLVTYTYDANSRISMESFGNGTKTVYGYDAKGLTKTITNLDAANSIASSLTYTFSADGLPITVTDQSGNVTAYTYDLSGQLTGVALPGGHTIIYAYDAAGNRTSVIDSGVTTSYATNSLNQYTSAGSTTYHYDANGNLATMTSGGATTTYTYDARGYLASSTGPAGTFTYSYNALGNLASYTKNGVRTDLLSDANGNIIATYDGSGNLLQNYTYGNGLISQTSGASHLFYAFDAVGNTTSLTNGAGAAVSTYAYLPFGEKISTTGSTTNLFSFSGKNGVLDLGDGLYRAKFRTYSPALGRFIEPDPMGYAAGDVNLYRYAANDPTTNIDPAGLALTKEEILAAINGFKNQILALESGNLGPQEIELLAKLRGNVASLELEIEELGTAAEEGPVGLAVFILTLVETLRPGTISSEARLEQSVIAGLPPELVNDLHLPNVPTIPTLPVVPQTPPDTLEPSPAPPSVDPTLSALEIAIALYNSHDPNEIVGPGGSGAALYITGAQPLPYIIFFENQSTATAPAQTVVVTSVLDPNVDLSTFQLTSIGWGSKTITVPAGLTSYSTRVSYVQPDTGKTILVDVSAALDLNMRTLTWTLKTLDPATLDTPADPLAGFLPPDDASGRGTGFVGYTVDAVAGLATGTAIHALASIVFDANTAITTKTWTNTIDAVAPTSSVTALSSAESTATFAVNWSGQDDANGSGIASYTIYVSTDGGAYMPWLSGTTATSAVYQAAPGHAYAFYSLATDGAGNTQATPTAAQATTTIPAIARTLTVTSGHPAKFTDAAGQIVTITLAGLGSAALNFLTAGGSADPSSFIVTGTTAKSTLSVKAARGVVTLSDVEVAGSLAAFNAKQGDLLGSFSVAGTLGALTLADVTAGPSSINIGAGGAATTFKLGTLHDLRITTAGAIKSFSANAWTNGGLVGDSLSAVSIAKLQVKGSFDASVTITGGGLSVGSFKASSITGGTWAAAGAKSISTGSIASTWTANFTGAIAALAIKGNISGSLTAASIGKIQAASMTGASITLNGTGTTLGALTVIGSLTNSTIVSAGNISKATIGGATGSSLFAGVNAAAVGTLPQSADLAVAAAISSFTDTGKAVFSDTFIAASSIGKATLANVNTNNGGIPFGISTKAIAAFTLKQPRQKIFHYTSKQPASVLAALPGDLKVKLL